MRGYVQAMGRYAVFQGRASRGEFWWFTLTLGLIVSVALIVDTAFISGPDSKTQPFAGLVVLAHVLPAIAVSVRRLHDIDRSGWWVFINLIPVGSLVLLVFACQAGTPGSNRFGPDPLVKPEGDATPALSLPAAGGASAPALAPSSSPTRRDVIAELERLARLRRDGALSEAEFKVMKAETLAQAKGA